jgi:outer membrane autotransporter protein
VVVSSGGTAIDTLLSGGTQSALSGSLISGVTLTASANLRLDGNISGSIMANGVANSIYLGANANPMGHVTLSAMNSGNTLALSGAVLSAIGDGILVNAALTSSGTLNASGWGTVSLQSAASLVLAANQSALFGPSVASSNTLAVSSGASVQTVNNVGINANLINAGTVNLGALNATTAQGGGSGSLTVSGGYVGSGGTLATNVALVAGTANQLIVSGSVAGSTNVVARVIDGGVGSSGQAILLVSGAVNTTNSNAFTIANGGRVTGSPYLWSMTAGSSGWYLSEGGSNGAPTLQSEYAGYGVLPAIAHQFALTGVNAMARRIGGIQRNEEADGLWMRGDAQQIAYGANPGFALNGQLYSFDFGVDTIQSIGDQGQKNPMKSAIGTWGSLKQGSFNTLASQNTGSAEVGVKGYNLGLYASVFDKAGAYVDATGQFGNMRAQVSPQGYSATAKSNLFGALSVEAGKRYEVLSNLTVAPIAQVNYTQTPISGFTDQNGNQVSYSGMGTFGAKAGMRIEGTVFSQDGTAIKPSITPMIGSQFKPNPTMTINSQQYALNSMGTWAGLEAGINGQITKGVTLYGTVSWQQSVSGTGYQSYGGTLGLRFDLK